MSIFLLKKLSSLLWVYWQTDSERGSERINRAALRHLLEVSWGVHEEPYFLV